MEQELERGQHISAIPPAQQSIHGPDTAATSGAWNAVRSERSRKAAGALIEKRLA
jgi:hypothetical protein